MSYTFDKTRSYRAQCLDVVDGDTADFLVDLGFRQYMKARFRFSRINTPELSSKDPVVRAKAQEAKDYVIKAICALLVPPFTNAAWQVRLVPEKDPDNYGRWLAEVFYTPAGTERSLNQELLDKGLAVLYKG
jgi:endonuclease YncB( thermonuclease family)